MLCISAASLVESTLQVKYSSVQRYRAASAAQAAARPAQAEADRIYRRIMQRPGGAQRPAIQLCLVHVC
jgi:hypothetical protein